MRSSNEFVQKIEALKTELSQRINGTNRICEKSQKTWNNYNESLHKFLHQTRPLRSGLRKYIAVDYAHKLYRCIKMGFHFVPQIYFSSLKLLRNGWYEYETSVALMPTVS